MPTLNPGAQSDGNRLRLTPRLQKLDAFPDEVQAIAPKLDDALGALWRRSKRAGVALRSSGAGGGGGVTNQGKQGL